MDFAPIVDRVVVNAGDHGMQVDSDSEESDSEVNVFEELEKLTLKNVGYPKANASHIAHLKDISSGPHMQVMDNPIGVHQTDLTGTQWLTFQNENLKNKFIKDGHLDSLTVVPKSNPMMPVAMKPIHVLQSHPTRKECVGVPRFFGISAFGKPSKDHRHTGSLEQTSHETKCALRPEQEVMIEKAMKMLETWGGTTIIADCGFGKTVTSIYLALLLKRRCLILCNREVLMNQWIESIMKFTGSSQIGFIMGSNLAKGPPGTVRPNEKEYSSWLKSYFTVGSIETFSEGCISKDILKSFGTIIVDEMHHIAAQSLVHVMPMFASQYIIGLTATPNRSDGLEHVLQWLTGPTCFVQQRLPKITGLSGTVIIKPIHFRNGEKKEIIQRNGNLGYAKMLTLLTEDPTRNELLVNIIQKASEKCKKVIVVTIHVEHSKMLQDTFLERLGPLHVAIMAGPHQMPFEAKQRSSTQIVFATQSLLEEGYDDPYLDGLVLTMPRSKIQQTIGRIERTHPGKQVPRVYDIIDEFSLFPNMFQKRQQFYKSRGFAIQ